MKSYRIHPKIEEWMVMVESGKIRACEEQHLLMPLIRKAFAEEDIYTDEKQFEKYLSLVKYLKYETVYEWESFLIGLHLCTYRKENDWPRWPDLFCMIGRGAGKDGFIAWESACLVSPYNKIKKYDVDICANNEEQAMRPVTDVIEAFDEPDQKAKMKRHFEWNKTKVRGRVNRGTIRGRTNNPKGKDGMRSGMIVFNEKHQYEDYKNINVFKTGLGKVGHPREATITTEGDVREGPLDEEKDVAMGILQRGDPDGGLLPFICRLNKPEEVHDPENWVMANPSLFHNKILFGEITKEYRSWKKNPAASTAFMTKRMNRPDGRSELQVTEWKNIEATNREMPDLKGWMCTVGIDYTKLNDWASVNFHFRKGNQRFDINHSWLCLQSEELGRVKAPWKIWTQQGLVTPVDEPEIPPEYLVEYIAQMAEEYSIAKLALDNYRFALMKGALQKIGFAPEYKNLYLARPSDIMKIQPVVSSCFTNQYFIWGDNPALRWATNNTKLVRSGRKEGTDTGNFYYAKIEAKSRKTDPFMALVASMTIEDCLGQNLDYDSLPDLGVITG